MSVSYSKWVKWIDDVIILDIVPMFMIGIGFIVHRYRYRVWWRCHAENTWVPVNVSRVLVLRKAVWDVQNRKRSDETRRERKKEKKITNSFRTQLYLFILASHAERARVSRKNFSFAPNIMYSTLFAMARANKQLCATWYRPDEMCVSLWTKIPSFFFRRNYVRLNFTCSHLDACTYCFFGIFA